MTASSTVSMTLTRDGGFWLLHDSDGCLLAKRPDTSDADTVREWLRHRLAARADDLLLGLGEGEPQ